MLAQLIMYALVYGLAAMLPQVSRSPEESEALIMLVMYKP